jgi:hypothetical protein
MKWILYPLGFLLAYAIIHVFFFFAEVLAGIIILIIINYWPMILGGIMGLLFIGIFIAELTKRNNDD